MEKDLQARDYHENHVEWLNEFELATVTLSRGRLYRKILKLAEERPAEVEIVSINNDGTLCARVPKNWIKINASRNLSDEGRNALVQNLQNTGSN